MGARKSGRRAIAVITKAERAELRSIVRQQFRVLRHQVEQRQAEVVADAEAQISDRYIEQDKAWSDAAHLAHEAVLEANRAVNDIYRVLMGHQHIESMYVLARFPPQPVRHRVELRSVAVTRIAAQVKSALLQLDRQEADLLRHLGMGALETAEAHAFLGTIPTVGQLVPAARLAELEAEFPEPDPDPRDRYA